ncbi:hypothetical protein B7486_69165 [cyanobacterium TDX16]|nr:hypothetical protein B7486_69165 [cyanobacterium TDX16]
MTTRTDPWGWDEADATRATRAPTPAAAPDPRFTPERAQELLDADREAERRLPWKQALALVLVLLVVLLRFTWLG